MNGEAAGFLPALALMESAAAKGEPAIVAIDGRCGSGKTSLARLAKEKLRCAVAHTDDFYLPEAERINDWARTPCANMDLARLRREVLEPFRAGEPVLYRPYRCGDGTYGEAVTLPAGGLLLVEGSYAHHPGLADLYDGKVFLTCDSRTQRRRLGKREGSRLSVFEKVWIPLEERYIRQFSIGGDCLVIDTTEYF